MKRFRIVPAGLECDTLELPYAPGIVFHVRRAGYAPFVEHEKERNKKMLAESQKPASRAGKKAMADLRRQGIKDEAALAEAFTEAFGAAVIEADISDEALEIAQSDNSAGIALLIAHVDGLEDESGPVEWSADIGLDLLRQYPVIASAILAKAEELQAAFDAFVSGAEKNSPASSAPVEAAADATISQPSELPS